MTALYVGLTFDYCGIIKIRGGKFSWFFNFLQVRGDVISLISFCREGAVIVMKGKITPEKFILFERVIFFYNGER